MPSYSTAPLPTVSTGSTIACMVIGTSGSTVRSRSPAACRISTTMSNTHPAAIATSVSSGSWAPIQAGTYQKGRSVLRRSLPAVRIVASQGKERATPVAFFSHVSIPMRAIGFVAHVNAPATASAEHEAITMGTVLTFARRPIAITPTAEPTASVTSSGNAPARVASTIAPPDPASRTLTTIEAGAEIEKLRIRPAVTSVSPAATGMSLKSTWDIPSHNGVESVTDQANTAARTDRSATASATASAVTESTERMMFAAPWYA